MFYILLVINYKNVVYICYDYLSLAYTRRALPTFRVIGPYALQLNYRLQTDSGCGGITVFTCVCISESESFGG